MIRKKRLWGEIQSKLQDDEIEVLRKEFGYMQEGSRYDPIEGKQAGLLPEDQRPASYWETFFPND